MRYDIPYINKKPKVTREIFSHSYANEDGDITDIKIEEVEKNDQYKEGIRYTLSYIRDGKALLRYDNYAGHPHHKHVKDKRKPYEYKDVWNLLEDFETDLKNMRIEPWKK